MVPWASLAKWTPFAENSRTSLHNPLPSSLGVGKVKSGKCTKSRTLAISLLINGQGRKEEIETCKSSRGF